MRRQQQEDRQYIEKERERLIKEEEARVREYKGKLAALEKRDKRALVRTLPARSMNSGPPTLRKGRGTGEEGEMNRSVSAEDIRGNEIGRAHV